MRTTGAPLRPAGRPHPVDNNNRKTSSGTLSERQRGGNAKNRTQKVDLTPHEGLKKDKHRQIEAVAQGSGKENASKETRLALPALDAFLRQRRDDAKLLGHYLDQRSDRVYGTGTMTWSGPHTRQSV